MPVFTQVKKEAKKRGRTGGIPQDVIDTFKEYISKLEKGSIGTLEFKKDENINQGRKALLQGGVELKKYVRVRKPRGKSNVLVFERITAKQWGASRKAAMDRGAKLKGKPKAKRKARKK